MSRTKHNPLYDKPILWMKSDICWYLVGNLHFYRHHSSSMDWWRADFAIIPKLNTPLFNDMVTKEEAFEIIKKRQFRITCPAYFIFNKSATVETYKPTLSEYLFAIYNKPSVG